MDVLDWLKIVLNRCQTVSRPEDALALLPDIGADAPRLVEVPVDGGPPLVAPVAFAGALTPALGGVISDLAERAAKSDEGLSTPSPDKLVGDPLVKALSALLLEAWTYGPRAASLVVLELCRQSALMLNGDPTSLRPYGAVEVGRAANAAALIQDLNAAGRARALRDIGAALSARIAVAHGLAGRLDARVRPGRLYQAIARNRLPMLFPSGALSFPADAATVAAVCGSQADAGVVSGLYAAVLAGAKAALAGGDGIVAQGTRDLAGRRKDPEALARDPALVSWIIHGIGELCDAKALVAAGVAKDSAKALIKGTGAAAMVTSYVDLLGHFRSWDLLSAVASFCEPLREEGGRWRSGYGAIGRRGPWGLLGPTGGAGVRELSVVALRREKLYKEAAKVAQERGHPALLSALEALWRGLAEDALQLGGALDLQGRVWLAAFDDAKAARAFAARAERTFSTRIRVNLGAFGGELALSDEAGVEVAEERGLVFGGWDGEGLHLAGAAVEVAIAALQGGAEESAGYDPSMFSGFAGAASDAPTDPPAAEDPFSGGAAPKPQQQAPAADPFSAPTQPPAGRGSLSDPFSEAPTVSSEMDEDEGELFGFASADQEPATEELSAGGASLDDPFAADDPFDAGGFGADDPFEDEDPPTDPGLDEHTAETIAQDEVPIEDRHTLLAAPPGLAEPPESDDPFQGLPEFEPGEEIAHDPFVDPLAGPSAKHTLSPDVIGWEDDADGELFSQEPGEDSPAQGGIVSFEIDDDDDSEVSVDMEFNFGDAPEDGAPEDSGEMFFLPPPVASEREDREERQEPDPAPPPEPKSGLMEPEPPDPDDALDFSFAEPGASQAPQPEPSLSGEGDDPFALGSGLGYESVVDLDEYSRQMLEDEVGPRKIDDPFAAVDALEPEPEPEPPAAEEPAAAGPNVLRLSGAEVAYMFNGYVRVEAGGEVIFGRRYGQKLIDVHSYPASDGVDKVYLAFVTDKIREGFLPQTDRSRRISDSDTVEELDLGRIGRALSDLGTG